MKQEELQKITKVFFNKHSTEIRSKDLEGNIYNLKSLYYNSGKNKGAFTIIKKGNTNNKYNEEDYPIILIYPGVMKIEHFYTHQDKSNNKYYLFIMEEILSNFKPLTKTLHDDGFSLLKIINDPFDGFIGNNLLKYFIKQLIYLLEFIDRNNLYFKDLSLENFFVTKKDFLLRLYNFNNIANFDDLKKPSDKKPTKKSLNNKNKELSDEIELIKKKSYYRIGILFYNLIFGNFIPKNEKENTDLYEDIKVDLSINYIKKIKAKNIDENLKELLIKLLDFNPEYRPNIEEIFRNKWIHEDYHIIDDIISNFEKDILKIISEFAKCDYLKRLESCLENHEKKNKIKENNIINNNHININKKAEKKSKIIKTGRFTYKKRAKKF